ncbi:MAG: hypothetical protein F2836_04735, partial [Actinobacteria bacterium]|nr:hypothetical protein [Actinomycetota bacterium]
MQMLLRTPGVDLFHHSSTAGVELAASPDSPARERWLWDVRLESAAAPLTEVFDVASLEVTGAGRGIHFINVRFDPAEIVAAIAVEVLQVEAELSRPESEIWITIIESGAVHDGSFLVKTGDVLVWEGDDPLTVTLRPAGDAQ